MHLDIRVTQHVGIGSAAIDGTIDTEIVGSAIRGTDGDISGVDVAVVLVVLTALTLAGAEHVTVISVRRFMAVLFQSVVIPRSSFVV